MDTAGMRGSALALWVGAHLAGCGAGAPSKLTESAVPTVGAEQATSQGELQGAAWAIRRAEDVADSASTESRQASPIEQLTDEVTQWRENHPRADAATQLQAWLAFGARARALPKEARYAPAWHQLSQALDAMFPGPAAWPQLELAAARAGDTVDGHLLGILAAWLNEDPAALEKRLGDLESFLARDRAALGYGRHDFRTDLMRSGALPSVSADVLFERMLSGGGGSSGNLDLAARVPPERADPLIWRALNQPNGVYLLRGPQTAVRAKELALARASELQVPPFELVQRVEDRALFEALQQHFPHVVGPGVQRATSVYAAALLTEGNVDGAFELVKAGRTDESFIYLLNDLLASQRGRTTLADFYTRLVDADMLDPFAIGYSHHMQTMDKGDEAIEVLQARVDAGASLEGPVGSGLQSLLLAEDRVTAAVNLLKKRLSDQTSYRAVESTRLLTTLGSILGEPQWEDEALELLESKTEGDDQESLQLALSLCHIELTLGRLQDAETCAADWMGRALKYQRAAGKEDAAVQLDAPLLVLLQAYAQGERWSDVLALLEQAPWWGFESLGLERPIELNVIAARALHEADRDDEALSLVKQVLVTTPSHDPAYAVLLDISPADIEPWLDALAARHPYEDRPLIWKAEWALAHGDAEQARSLAERALTIDPTDGEQPAGDRIRGYGTMARALEALDRSEDAALYASIVRSVRVAEEGDVFREVGLQQRALRKYREASEIFGNAYCVHWRIAERLFAEGKLEEARPHYEEAFSRMPEQFGRVANVCFGCEGAFRHVFGRTIAERVLMNAAKASGGRAQVYYLLGQLYAEADRLQESLQAYAKAAEMDPTYLDAWAAYARLLVATQDDSGKLQQVTVHLIELDPLGRHSGVNITDISSPRIAWQTMEKALAKLPEVDVLPAKSFELSASARALASLDEDALHGGMSYYAMGRRPRTPAAALAEYPAYRPLTDALITPRP